MELFLHTIDYANFNGDRSHCYLIKVVNGLIRSVVLADQTYDSQWCFNELFALDRTTLDTALRFNRKRGRIACLYMAGYRILEHGARAYHKILKHPHNRAILDGERGKCGLPTLVELCLRRCPRSQLNRSIVKMFDYFRSCPHCGGFYHPARAEYCCRFQYFRLKRKPIKTEPLSPELIKFWHDHPAEIKKDVVEENQQNDDEGSNCSEGSNSAESTCLFPDPSILPLIDPPRFVY